MSMQLTMLSSISSSGCSYFYPRNHVFAASLAERRRFQPGFSISSKLSSSCDWEVVKGMDCLPNPKTPWVKLSSGIDPSTGLVVDSFYSLLDNQEVRLNRRDCLGVPDTAKCFAVTGEWLAFVDSNDDCPVYLTNPFFNCNDPNMGGVIRLPSLATIPSCAGVERDPQTDHVTKFNMFAPSAADVKGELSIDEVYLCEHEDMVRCIKNLSISHLDPRHADCVAVALQGVSPTLAYSRIWVDDTTLGWIGLQEDYQPSRRTNQLAFSHAYKMFYTINEQGLEVFDLFSDGKKRSRRALLFPEYDFFHCMDLLFKKEKNKRLKDLRNKTYFDLEDKEFFWRMHIVVLNDNGKSSDLLLILRHFEWGLNLGKTLHFDVFKVDFYAKSLVPVKSLEEQCIFVGADQSFSLCASKFPGLQPNSIYFIDRFEPPEAQGLGKDRGIFNLANNKIKPLQHPISNAGEKLFWISPSIIRK